MKEEIKLLVVDVDGTMTDGGIYYDEYGNELKKFSVRDAAGFFVAHKVGMKIMVLTGRECQATYKRMQELKIDFIYQNIKNKHEFLWEFMKKNNIKKSQLYYIGDDLNDIMSMRLAGYIGCPADSCLEVREIANYVSPIKGGEGAVRDIIEHLMRENNQWNFAVSEIYGIGI